ncbi:uncharacterized protein LOC113860818 [Abrus precatorius]|uniref:Uncharacterized protein LOC113860818 n=1 Tax=Abrus precatorius TaxID=3816 RepID=A0A8B8L398_ABRPR|nr:uncharacterized protein LOC113860818 [Abrus precatorius]
MWQILLAAAVAGSTAFVAKRFLSLINTQQTQQCNEDKAVQTTVNSVDNVNLMFLSKSHESVIETCSSNSSELLRQGGSNKHVMGRRGSKNGIRIAKVELGSVAEVRSERRNGGKRFPLCSNRRKAMKNIARKNAFCSSKASTLFGWGVSFGIMCMMPGKAEINELTKIVSKTTKVVEELKSELNRRKSLLALDYVGNTGIDSCKMSAMDDAIMLKKTKSELGDTDIKFWSFPVINNGECESSSLTDESDPLILEMDQLEAELEFELQKLPGHTIDTNCQEELWPKLDEVKDPNEGCDETDEWNFNSSQHRGISPYELNQKLCQLLIEQQENQIADLESELNLAQSKLYEKEAELQALKNCVRLLTDFELPLSTDSGMIVSTLDRLSLKSILLCFLKDVEIEAHKGANDWDSNTMDTESKQSVGGVKRSVDSESCSYYPRSDSDESDLYGHTGY